MQLTITKIEDGRYTGRIRRSGKTETIDLHRQPVAAMLLASKKVGDKVEVMRKTNSPYVYLIH